MSESPPHVPQPFPYVWPGANPLPPPPALPTTTTMTNGGSGRYGFAHSSSKRPRSEPSSSSDNESANDDDDESSEDDLNDPFDLDPAQDGKTTSLSTTTTTDEQLTEANKGMQMLLKLGWAQGKGLGKDLQGRVNPIDPSGNTGMMGLGKAALDTRMLDNTTLTTRQLESQKIAKETADQRKARMDKAAFKKEVEAEIAATLEKFRCDICNKSYTTVGQYDEHTNSYDHHHRARAIALKQATRDKSNATGESERRREKERKREAKELAKIMGAAGVVAPALTGLGTSSTKTVGALSTEQKSQETETTKKGGGWAKFGTFKSTAASTPTKETASSPAKPAGGGGGFKKAGWVSSSVAPVEPTASTSRIPAPPAFQSGGVMSLSRETDRAMGLSATSQVDSMEWQSASNPSTSRWQPPPPSDPVPPPPPPPQTRPPSPPRDTFRPPVPPPPRETPYRYDGDRNTYDRGSSYRQPFSYDPRSQYGHSGQQYRDRDPYATDHSRPTPPSRDFDTTRAPLPPSRETSGRFNDGGPPQRGYNRDGQTRDDSGRRW